MIIQAQERISEKLQRVQWIDFRRGIRKLREVGMLLDEPSNLLAAIGVMPSGNQPVAPPFVQTISYYLAVNLLTSVSAWVTFYSLEWETVIESSKTFINLDFVIFIIAAILMILLGVGAVKGLNMRRGLLSSFWGLLFVFVATFILLIVLLLGTNIGGLVGEKLVLDGNRSYGAIIMQMVFYIYGFPLIVLVCLRYWKDMWLWFPKRVTKKIDVVE